MTAQTRFDRHPRVRLLDGPTPIQRLRRVEAALGPGLNGTRLFVTPALFAYRDELACTALAA